MVRRADDKNKTKTRRLGRFIYFFFFRRRGSGWGKGHLLSIRLFVGGNKKKKKNNNNNNNNKKVVGAGDARWAHVGRFGFTNAARFIKSPL